MDYSLQTNLTAMHRVATSSRTASRPFSCRLLSDFLLETLDGSNNLGRRRIHPNIGAILASHRLAVLFERADVLRFGVGRARAGLAVVFARDGRLLDELGRFGLDEESLRG